MKPTVKKMDTCERIRDRLNDYLDGTLSAPEATEITRHLEECAGCAREYHALRRTIALLRAASAPQAHDSRERVMTRFRRAAFPARAARMPLWTLRPLPAAAAAGMTAILVLMLWLQPGISPPTPSVPPYRDVSVSDSLPSSEELDRMTSLHAVYSRAVIGTGGELHRDALADATSRIEAGDPGEF